MVANKISQTTLAFLRCLDHASAIARFWSSEILSV